MYKPIPWKEKCQKNLKLGFSGLKVLLLCPQSDPWTGNQLVSDDVENCQNYKFLTSLVTVSAEILLK